MRSPFGHALLALGITAAITLAGGPAWADLLINASPPSGAPTADNGYNCEVISDSGGQPIPTGTTVTLTSSSAIASVAFSGGGGNGFATAGSPYQAGNGNSNVDVTLGAIPGLPAGGAGGHAMDTGITVIYKNGKKRCFLIFTNAKKVTIESMAINFTNRLVVNFSALGESGETIRSSTEFRNWVPPAPARPIPQAPPPPGIKDND